MFFLPDPATSALAVAMIYCIWRRAYEHQRQRRQILRERVTYMLWAAAMETS